jgi:sirohydrochlorin ferrochelatase
MSERRGGIPLVLVAHGSRDSRAARSTWALARAVRRRLSDRPVPPDGGTAGFGPAVDAAFLDFTPPRPSTVLAARAARGQSSAVVVPLLLTAAYHGRVDVPSEISRARAGGPPIEVGLAEVLGPVGGALLDRDALDLMTTALVRRLDQAGGLAGCDAVLLAGAGSRDAGALRTVDLVADAVGAALERPCRAGYASGDGPGVAASITALRAAGARRIAVASYFLAPGLLHDRAVADARRAGAVATAAPLGDAPEIARLVLRRATAAARRSEPIAA